MPPKKIRVCSGPHCNFRGSGRVLEELEKSLGVKRGQPNAAIDLNFCNCTNNCDFGPNVVEDDTLLYRGAKTKDIANRINSGQGEAIIPLNPDDISLEEDLLA